MQCNIIQNNIWYDKTKTSTSRLDKTNQQEEKNVREDTSVRDPLFCTLRNPIKTSNQKP